MKTQKFLLSVIVVTIAAASVTPTSAPLAAGSTGSKQGTGTGDVYEYRYTFPSDNRSLPAHQWPSICFDPLLGYGGPILLDPSLCGTGEQTVTPQRETAPESLSVSNNPIVEPVVELPAVVVVTVEPAPVVTLETEKVHCNKGEGNGGEGCDPGKHPEKGNDDENEREERGNK